MSDQIPFIFDIPSVSELTHQIKQILENQFRDILVEGEISNVKQSRNGHYYFTVKDDNAQLPCVIWRSTAQRLNIDLRDGQQVVLGGDIQVYAPHGRYQMIVNLVQQAGIGKLQQKFEKLKKRLEQEGLFDDAHKKPLPPFPMKIGVITSSTGAAFQDIRSTFEQRWPAATLCLYHASVQGLNAAGELAEAIHYFSERDDLVDILIVGRGGGSLEDLWPFNEEIVARALFNCPVPTISAVGHEVDFSISDFVADARAATPTQAVIIATPDINELRYQIDDYTHALDTIMQQKVQLYRDYVHQLTHSHALLAVQDKLKYQKSRTENTTDKLRSLIQRTLSKKQSDHQQLLNRFQQQSPEMKIQSYSNQTASLRERLINRYEKIVAYKTTQLHKHQSGLAELNPKAPMERGFTRILQDGSWIREKETFSKDKPTEIEWKDGRITLN